MPFQPRILPTASLRLRKQERTQEPKRPEYVDLRRQDGVQQPMIGGQEKQFAALNKDITRLEEDRRHQWRWYVCQCRT